MLKCRASLLVLGFLTAAGCGRVEDLLEELRSHQGPPPPKPCASSANCSAGTVCSVEAGVCNAPPGCERPGVVCPAVCYGTCEPAPKGERCGPVVCQAGTACCNESCGICVPPGGACTQQFCDAPPPQAQCGTDADCRTFAFTCTGCQCLALGVSDPEPTCPGSGVQCFADPCRAQSAVCDAGRCRLAPVSCAAGFDARRVCTACGPAGGCAKVADCARTCRQASDCAADNLPCVDGLCQAVGCI